MTVQNWLDSRSI